MGNRRMVLLISQILVLLVFCAAQGSQSGSSANPGQSNTTTTRTTNPDGSTTVTTTTTYSDGSTTTTTTYDKNGNDAGTTRTDVQTKDGTTTTTVTKYDGKGHETGKTVKRVDKDGKTTITEYDGNGNVIEPTWKPGKPDFKLEPKYNVPDGLKAAGSQSSPGLQTQNQTTPQPKPQGLTPEDQEKIRKALNPDQTPNSAAAQNSSAQAPASVPGHPDWHMLPCPECADAWREVLEYSRSESSGNPYYTGAGEHFYRLYLECVKKHCPELNPEQQRQTNNCPTGMHCTPCPAEEKCENPKVSNCPTGMHCFPCYPDEKCEGATQTSAGPESPLADPNLNVEDKVTLMLMLIMKHMDEKIKQQAQQQNQGTSTPPTMTESIVGIVTPSHRQNDKPFSGSITTDPKQFQGIPGLQVQEVKLKLVIGSDGKPMLQLLLVDTGDGILQPAQQAINFNYWMQPLQPGAQPRLVPPAPFNGNPGTSTGAQNGPVPNGGKTEPTNPGGQQLQLTLHQPGGPPVTVPVNPTLTITGDRIYHRGERGKFTVQSDVEGDMTLSGGEPKIKLDERKVDVGVPASSNRITTNPVCQPGKVTAVHGPGQFSGDASRLLVSLNGEPVSPIAATTDGFFVQLPPTLQPGQAQLLFTDQGPNGWFAASTTINVLRVQTGIANPNLHRGLHTTATVGLSMGGYTGFKAPQTRQGEQNDVFVDPDLVSLTELQKQVPDFHPPEKAQQGFIALSIQNRTPGIISIDGGNMRTWYLKADSLPFNTQLGIKAIADGGFDIGVIAQPLFPLVRMQQYRVSPKLVEELETIRIKYARAEFK